MGVSPMHFKKNMAETAMPREMRRLLEIFLGIKPAPWAEGGSWRLEWLSMPKHDKLLMLIVLAAAATWGVMYLYRREGRSLSLTTRIGLSALRMIVRLPR